MPRESYRRWLGSLSVVVFVWRLSSFDSNSFVWVKQTKIWNGTRARVLVQNQHTRELISARKTSDKHNNKTWVVYVPFIYSRVRWVTVGLLRSLLLRLSDVFRALRLYTFFYLLVGQVSYRRRLRSLLLCLCDVFGALINSLVCWFK